MLAIKHIVSSVKNASYITKGAGPSAFSMQVSVNTVTLQIT